MDGRVSKSRRTRVKLSRALQEQLLDAIAKKDTEVSKAPIQKDSISEGCLRNPPKRRFDQISETDDLGPVPTKRARLAEIEVQQPRPLRAKSPYVSFLQDFIDPIPNIHTGSVFVSEWLESVGSDRQTHCRSDSQLYYSAKSSISPRSTSSVPDMGTKRDADGFVVPPTPDSTISPYSQEDEGENNYASCNEPSLDAYTSSRITRDSQISKTSSGRGLIESPSYRWQNLADNNIYLHHPCDPLPEHIVKLIKMIRQDHGSTSLSLDDLKKDRGLYDLQLGATEPEVELYLRQNMFPRPGPRDILMRALRQPMVRQLVPNAGFKSKVSTPVPDILYGYNFAKAFVNKRSQLLASGVAVIPANHQGVIYPFFVVEFKGETCGSGSLWAATNQCLGGSASCVNCSEFLNRQLRESRSISDKCEPMDTAAFSVATNGTEARLHVSWKDNEQGYSMAIVDSFLLQRPEDFLELRKCVLNIIDWGMGKRLEHIRAHLDTLIEGSRQRTPETAQSHSPLMPTGTPASTGSRKKRRTS
ncbi:hypothetical protein F5B22DRAFT_495813 [Xylaria bambusicola]|uniref:uncharacterized protein n=1 Tax=Xylaria bambusicola TaxID=326684 RepID=UPI0020081231|nr:uncharacterized protein F5B22DRAFT_495813 [Xylaria bambusicola]KAI0505752.1 hypothetical protein F5B22DRAFT_495813 [Xylaria bambusicola]